MLPPVLPQGRLWPRPDSSPDTAERVLNALGNSGIIRAGVDVQTEDRVEHESDQQGRAGGGDHRGHVIEQAGLGDGGGEVGGVGQGGELIADIRAGDDHTGGDGGIDAQARADAEERKADGGGGGPGGAARQTNDRAEDAAQESFYQSVACSPLHLQPAA